ncbi:MAG: branched-chain amino acid ABC transporter permease [Candidimonas sp.]
MSTNAATSRVLIALAVVVAVLLPVALSDFHVFQATQILIYAIAILGLNLLIGYNSQISLGHGAFYAIGAYVVAILMAQYEVSYFFALPAAAAICFVAGFLFGLPALKLEGHYLALATFALALAVPQLLKYPAFEPWTGGVQGIFVLKPDPPFGLPLGADHWLYYFTLAITLGVFLMAANLLDGRVGRALVAIRDQPVAAETMGINIAMYKAITFGVSALYTGLAGGLSAIVIQFVAPDSFTMFLSIFLLVGVVIGGVASIPGAFLDAAFIVIIPNVAADISKAATGAVYGLLLIVFVYLLPRGAWGGITVGCKWLTRRASL